MTINLDVLIGIFIGAFCAVHYAGGWGLATFIAVTLILQVKVISK